MAQGSTVGGLRPEHMLPMYTGDELRQALSRYDRKPFMDVLAAWLECAPTPDEVIKFASKKPDMYIKAISDLARLAGYTDKREVDVNYTLRLGSLSDSQLEDRAKQLMIDLKINPEDVIDGSLAFGTEEEQDPPEPQTQDSYPQLEMDLGSDSDLSRQKESDSTSD